MTGMRVHVPTGKGKIIPEEEKTCKRKSVFFTLFPALRKVGVKMGKGFGM